jgi:DNA-binding MarR family transcriptional regulator
MIIQRVLFGIMADRAASDPRSGRPDVIGVGFLLAQLGAHSAAAYAKRIQPLGLTPPQVGVLRAIGERPGRSQQAIADEFGLPPSRMVGFIDDLEARGLVQRRRDDRDRRVHLLHLSEAGEDMLGQLASVASDAEHELLAPLTDDQRASLAEWLTRIADGQGLTRGVHPGYSRLHGDRDGVACPPSQS